MQTPLGNTSTVERSGQVILPGGRADRMTPPVDGDCMPVATSILACNRYRYRYLPAAPTWPMCSMA